MPYVLRLFRWFPVRCSDATSPRGYETNLKTVVLFFSFLGSLTGPVYAQSILQRCIGVVPGQEPTRQLGPSPATISSCQQLPGWNLFDQARQRFEAGDRAGSAKLLKQSAEAGNPLAQLHLALMFSKGDGVARDAPTALRWFKAAADAGEPAAQDLLGTMYEYGKSKGYPVDDDWDLAAKLWQASASQGWMNGEFSLGRAYQFGIGVPLSLQKAIPWYDKAAAQGHAQAKYFAKYLRDNHGFDGSSRDDDERKLLGPLLGRTMPFIPPEGMTFHHLAERVAFVKREFATQERGKVEAEYRRRSREYQECRDAGRSNCLLPGPAPR